LGFVTEAFRQCCSVLRSEKLLPANKWNLTLLLFKSWQKAQAYFSSPRLPPWLVANKTPPLFLLLNVD